MASIRRKSAAVALAVVGVAGLTLASAATLTINSSALAAGTTVVAACDNDGVGLTYTTAYSAGAYQLTAVTVTGIAPACVGQAISVNVSAAGVSVGEVSGVVVAGGTFVATLPASTPAAPVTGAAIVIHS
jgi:hypothetical protein